MEAWGDLIDICDKVQNITIKYLYRYTYINILNFGKCFIGGYRYIALINTWWKTSDIMHRSSIDMCI